VAADADTTTAAGGKGLGEKESPPLPPTPAPTPGGTSPPVTPHHLRTAADLAVYFSHAAHRSRHTTALQLVGLGSPAETLVLLLVACFGLAVLVFTTVSSVLSVLGVGNLPEPNVCRG
jgi:hypothetical protein